MAADTREGFQVAVGCTECRKWRVLTAEQLTALAAQKGPAYSLVNRRCVCRMTAGCTGWNRFFYQSGCMRPLWDRPTSWRWMGINI